MPSNRRPPAPRPNHEAACLRILSAEFSRNHRWRGLRPAALVQELERFGEGTLQTIIMGDINVYEISWLKYSDGSTLEGRDLLAFANLAGLSERVGKPTRGPNLLDLVLSDLGTELTCAVHPGIGDHEAVVGTVKFNIPEIF